MEAALRSLMRDTVTVEEPATVNKAGETLTYEDAVTYSARCVGQIRAVRNHIGQEKVSTVTTYLGQAVTISPRARITLPAHFVPRTPPIVSVAQYPDERGRHHTVVYT